MSDIDKLALPDDVRADLDRAVAILKEGGCSEVYLFGSWASGRPGDDADIDLAIRGCPRGRFFHLLGKIMWDVRRSVDLVDLDTGDRFARYLQEESQLVRIG